MCDGNDNWHHINKSCIKYFEQEETWFQSRSICKTEGGDLYYPKSYEMVMSIGDLLVCRTVDEQAWIGVQPGRFLGVDNSTMRYQPWQGSNRSHRILKRYIYASRQKGNTCVLSNPLASFYWEVEPCDSRKKFICEKPQGTCPDGWRRSKDMCFQIYDSTNLITTWVGAYNYCKSQGTDLAVIESLDEEQTLEAFLRTRRVTEAWIGCSEVRHLITILSLYITDINVTDTIQWIDGRSLSSVSYKHWAHGRLGSSWSNTYCFNNKPFICKKKVVAPLLQPTPPPATSHCDPGWKLYNSNCYYFGAAYNMTGYSWDNARRYCFSQNADLTTIKDPMEQSFITCKKEEKKNRINLYTCISETSHISNSSETSNISNSSETSYNWINMEAVGSAWIGLKYYKDYKQYLWSVDHSPANYKNYYPGEPDDLDSGQACIQILAGRQDYTGSWDDGNCSTPQDFICKKAAVGTWSYRCGPSWTYNSLDEFCYQIVTDAFKTWADANYDCKQRGGYLLSISGPKEQTFIQAMLNTGVYLSIQANYWIGASDATQEGGWEWIDNAPFSYLHWHPVSSLTVVTVPAWGYQWNDKRCDKEQHYICKKIPDPPTQKPGAPTQTTSKKCVVQPMISGEYSLLDSQSLSASSSRDSTHGPASSRWYPGSRGGWSSQTTTSNEYIQATFYNVVVIKGIITVGRSDANEWVTQYRIRYQYDYFDEWLWYEEPPGTVKIFTGNTDNVNPVNRTIQFPIEAKAVRLYPLKYNRGMSLRWEVLGCIEEFCTPDYAVSGPLIVMDVQFRTSSNSDSNHAGPAARLSPIRQGVQIACWRPASMDTNQYIQVDLGNTLIIRGVTTMGNPDAQEWVTEYQISYGMMKFQGNTDNNDTVTNFFKGHFQGRFLRLWPTQWHGAIAVRLDILVCTHGCKGLALISGPKTITDDMLNATSSLDSQHGPARSRLNQPAQGNFAGGWTAQYNDLHQYIQADLGSIIQITGVATQGREDGSGQWVKSYYLSYSQDGNNWVSYSGIQRNALHLLYIPFLARYVRLWPRSWNNQISLRWELYGCPGHDSNVKVLIVIFMFILGHDSNVQVVILIFRYILGPDCNVQVLILMFTFNLGPDSNVQVVILIFRYILGPDCNVQDLILMFRYILGPDSGFSLGCYADDTHDRDLPLEPFTDPTVGMWPPMCIHHCFRKGYYYAGIQAQYKCFCGNTYGRYGPSTSCNMNCYPRTRFHCGGLTSNIIYSTGLIPQNEVCPPQWKSYKDYCYLVLLDRKTWKEARYDCHMMGGDLATINSQAEQDLIYSIINGKHSMLNFLTDGGKDVWIGLNDKVEENLFQWARGEPVMYTNWDIHQPEHPANQDEDCVMIAPGLGGWRDEVCDSTHQYVCQAHKHSSNQPSTVTQSTGCEKGWDAYRWSCYLYIDMQRNYNDAYTLCRSRGATFVKIEDRYEQAYLSSVLGSRKGKYWTYITDAYSPGTFKFLDGACQGCCVAIDTGNSAGLWNDILCNSTVGAICEKTSSGAFVKSLINYPDARNRLLDYDGALQDCRKQSTDLVSFHNQTSLNLLYKHLSQGRSYWLGLDARTSVNSKLVYRWTDQTPLDFIFWNPNEPNNYHGAERCAQITSYGAKKWNDVRCSARMGWICKMRRGIKFDNRSFYLQPENLYLGIVVKTQKHAETNDKESPSANYQPRTTMNFVLPTVSGGAGSCGSALTGWKYYNNHCYIAIDGVGKMSKTWREARQWCANNGADLVAINTIFEQIFVNQQLWNPQNIKLEKRGPFKILSKGHTIARDWILVTNITTTDLWIGLSEIDFEYGYRRNLDIQLQPYKPIKVTHGGPTGSTVGFVNWAPGQPDDYDGAEDCVEYQVAKTKWNDAHCAEKKGFMCELSLSATPPPTVPSAVQGYCPVGFSGYKNRCFKVVIAHMNWTQASKSCQSLGGGRKGYYLASILNKYESGFIM
ncbi:hypothetical protein KUTeg_024162 [Tegillarca granosa]|uniref:Uncharacterized protein n=1 Tax=Tegillarca granosa TaxID=220873 RepID=A0ABQ9DZL3_TEGGR|nr:hypothetical protein KUTeg_024162 [Tegillarca granosa]